MKAMILRQPSDIDTKPLVLEDLPIPEPAPNQLRLKVHVCALCHTDLHIVEGEIAPHLSPVVPGHQIVGVVDKLGEGATRFSIGQRLGVPWLYRTDQTCCYCQKGLENLCEHGKFTGYDANGGYAEYHVVDEAFAYPIPERFSDIEAAPLLCAGVIGYRALRLSEIKPGGRLGLYGFGASAHISLQIVQHWGCEVYVYTRGENHKQLARELGAKWVGGVGEETPPLDSAIIFAPAGGLVVEALKRLDKGGTLALAGIYMTPIPQFDYPLLYGERTIRSVANSTRQDALDLLRVAAEIPVRTETQLFDLDGLNQALADLKYGKIKGSGVVKI
ncbi:MAG: zinc-dependent alcohol dehydrogenase family protein [Chloroflexi bacterium]|uniref:alcohol dehydrogenase n=1 Tax=Candidatus Chlorohelix allophototropha TaxID=3003348 RepID=A0A8T7M3K9_9CHLR|nr:zinc-dependent alcohol dehydrogenase family protein [Chloroflexota bacterium]WJW65601.1 zinc-dependent alcohol dehydrogenase family protein [Chloroflexota bacterium L227-S17]